MEWGIPSTGGGHVMIFTDRGTRAVMKIFTARVRSTRAVKIHYSPSAEVTGAQKSVSRDFASRNKYFFGGIF